MEINSILLAFLLTMIAGLSTGVGSLIAFFAKRTNTKFLSAALGFSAGVMIYISFMELMPEALGMLSESFSPRMSNIYMLIAFFSGTSFIALIDFLIPEDENPHEVHRVEELSGQQRLHRTGILMALAISIHNFPEGLATFASALGNIDIAIPIVIAIAIANIAACLNILFLILSSRCFFFDNYIIRHFIAKSKKNMNFCCFCHTSYSMYHIDVA